jgi:membrane protein DedA with SNARE-associated domain/rhodanese-related sulfurtransferase
MARHGYALVFYFVLAEATGFPVPAALALVAGGAAAGTGTMSLPGVFFTALVALLLGDCLLFILGRYTGWALLGLLCRLSVNPETCILRSAESFYKRGKMTLLIAKFIPGVNTMAPPLAGSMKMRPWQFLRFDIAGAALYASAYITLGYIFRRFLALITRRFIAASHLVEAVVFVAIAAYIVYRIWLYRKNAMYRIVPRIQVHELAQRLASDEEPKPVIIDVRSHGYYDSDALRIEGSVRIEPNNLTEEVKELSKERDVYLYCTCQREATSARVAHLLREQGFNAFVIVGGLAAWKKSGLPLESVPTNDLVKLPTFS